MSDKFQISAGLQVCPESFDVRFSRCTGVLYYLAFRILGRVEEVEDAVQSCRIAAFQDPPEFESEGAFRAWLIRILTEKALLLLHERRNRPAISTEPFLSVEPLGAEEDLCACNVSAQGSDRFKG
jgi:RNA polymerase sigma-70 factor (ECF subfamily)